MLIKAGDMISNGVCKNIYLSEPDDEIVLDFGNLGTAVLTFSRKIDD